MAERTSVSDDDVLTAIGDEAAGRIGEAFAPRGFHGCLVAIFGGAVAAARLLPLDAPHMAQGAALPATSIGGLMAGGEHERWPRII